LGQAEDVAIDVRKPSEKIGGGPAHTREPRKARDGGVLVRIGSGSTSAVMAALAFGFTLGLVVKYSLADAGPRRVPARLSDLEAASATSLDLLRPYGSQMPSTSGMRFASLEMPVSGFPAGDMDPHALARLPGFFGELVFKQDLQPLARRWCGGGRLKEAEQVHAALRPNSFLKNPFLSVGIVIAMFSPASRRAAAV
jgi:hypothetical protein